MSPTAPISPHHADLFAEACIAYRASDRHPILLVGSDGTDRLLARLGRQVAAGGQIHASMRNFTAAARRSFHSTPQWRGRGGQSVAWLIFSLDFLAARCASANMTLTMMMKTWKYTLLRIAPS